MTLCFNVPTTRKKRGGWKKGIYNFSNFREIALFQLESGLVEGLLSISIVAVALKIMKLHVYLN